MTRAVHISLFLVTGACLLPSKALAQGETTSAIVGEVRDSSNTVVTGATLTIASQETGLRRRAQSDDAGRFNFPQLKPGAYSIKVEARGFEAREIDNVAAGLAVSATESPGIRLCQV